MHRLAVVLLLVIPLVPVYAQQSVMNKSIHYDTVQVPFNAFNAIKNNPTIFKLPHEHVTNWQLTIENKLQYSDPKGNAVIRLYEDPTKQKFIEIGLGAPPDRKIWVAVNTPEEGYFVVHEEPTNGWDPQQVIAVQHTSNGGLSSTIGKKVLVDNLDVNGFTVRDYAVYGKLSASDPQVASGGSISLNIVSGNPAANPIFYMPFIIVGVTGAVIAVLIKTKKR